MKFVLLFFIFLFACGCGRQGIPRQAVMIVLDAARSDRFSCYGYGRKTTPNIDGLAERGHLFLNHYTQGTDTHSSLPTILYSRYYALPLFPTHASVSLVDPETLFLRRDDQCISLPRALSKAGLRTAAISAHVWLREGTIFAGEFDELHNLTLDSKSGSAYPSAEKVVDFVIQWIEENRDSDYFLYIHMMDTHFPHSFGEEARNFLHAPQAPTERFDRYGQPKNSDRSLPEKDRAYLDALYDGSLQYADRHIGRLVSNLEEMESLEDTLIIITSDHGEHLLEFSNRFQHGGLWYEPVARIPLILHYPGVLDQQRIKNFSENVDLYPTILHLLRCPLPAAIEVDGKNLVPCDKADDYVFMEKGIRGERFKLLSLRMNNLLLRETPVDPERQEGELFDLFADPAEVRNLWSDKPDVVDNLLSVFRNHMKARYERHKGAFRKTQPQSPFAVSGAYFQSMQNVIVATPDVVDPYLADDKMVGKWIVSRNFVQYWLLGREGAPPLYIYFPIPNGEYEITASVVGHGGVTLRENEAPLKVHGPPLVPGKDIEWKDISLGQIKIKDNTFRAILTPLAVQGGFLIRYIGFQPSGLSESDRRGPDQEVLDKLKALGYAK